MWSAPKPSAASRRVAAISACSSGLPRPYFTRITPCPARSQSNFGVVPLMLLTTSRQSTTAFGSRLPDRAGWRRARPARWGRPAGCQTRAARSAAARCAGVSSASAAAAGALPLAVPPWGGQALCGTPRRPRGTTAESPGASSGGRPSPDGWLRTSARTGGRGSKSRPTK